MTIQTILMALGVLAVVVFLVYITNVNGNHDKTDEPSFDIADRERRSGPPTECEMPDVHEGTSRTSQISKQQNQNKPMEEQSTKDILFPLLWEMGCQPEEVDGGINIAYQGENFRIMIDNRLVTFIDLPWFSCNENDPTFNLVMYATNTANYNLLPSLIFSKHDEEGNYDIFSIYKCFIVPELPDLGGFLRAIFSIFFDTKRMFHWHLSKLKEDAAPSSASDSSASSPNSSFPSPSQN